MTIQIGLNYTAAIHQSAGIGRYTRELVNTLACISNDGFEPSYRLFVADVGRGRDFAAPLPGSNFTWCPTRLTERWLNRLWFRLRLPLPIQRWTGPIGLFHAPDFVLPPVKRGTRTILTIHDLSFVHEPESIMPRMSTYLNKWVPESVKRADHVIAVSEATRQDLIDLYQTPPEKISVLYHGVSPEFRPIQDTTKLTAIRRKYNLGDQPFILSVGTVQPRKNYRRLIQAFAQLDEVVSLVIAGGKGWHFEEIFNEVTKQRLEQRVHLLGFVPDDDLPALYNAATAAISRLLADSDLRQRLAKAGLTQAAKFTWPEMGMKLLRLYQQVLE